MKNLITEKAGAQGLTDAMLAEGLSPTGNHGRIAAAIRKSLAGEPVTLGVIGGSITEGTASSAAENSYAGQFKTWWETLFPGGEVTLVNAGKGATGSLIGAHRVEEDLLAHQPDVVVVEYAVNDGNGERDQMAYESLLRRILKAENQPGVLLLFTMKEDGTSVQRNQSKIGQHYDVPMVSYRNAVYPAVEDGRIPWTEISPDGIHPNDKGHAMIGVLLANYLVSVYEKLDSLSADGYVLPEPLVGDAYENGILYTNKNLEELQAGSFMRQVNSFYQFPYGWKAVRSSMGAVFRRPIYSGTPEELAALLHRSGLPLYGAALREDTVDARQADYTRCTLAIGSEGRGLSREVLNLCDQTIRIPMSDRCESLNAAIAAAVLLWESWR